jgi:hypothetical protein
MKYRAFFADAAVFWFQSPCGFADGTAVCSRYWDAVSADLHELRLLAPLVAPRG